MLQDLPVEYVNYLIYAGTFLGILIAFTGLAQLIKRGENVTEARSRRMKMIQQGATTDEIFALLKPDYSRSLLSRVPLIGNLPQMMSQAGMTMAPDRFLTLCGFATAILMFVGALFYPPWQTLAIAIGAGFLLPLLLVKNQKDKRMEKLTQQLPEALDVMARGLRVGHPLNTSIGAVAEEMPDPIGTEFGLMFDQISYGDDLTDAVADFADRVEMEDARYLSASIGIQHGTGGDLARVISILATTIRGRMALRKRIMSITAEGRLTGVILSVIPFVIFFGSIVMNPAYFLDVREDPLFVPMLVTILVLTVLNFLVLRKLVNFRV